MSLTMIGCCAYKDIAVKLNCTNGVIHVNLDGDDAKLYLSFSPMQANNIAEGISNFLAVAIVPADDGVISFGDANIIYETEENPDEEKMEVKDVEDEALPLAGAA